MKKIALLREENDELADERRRLRKKVTRFETQVGTLNKIIEEQDLEIDSLRTLDAAQRRQITRLKERLGDQEAELEELRDNWETHILCCPMFEGSDSSFEFELPPQRAPVLWKMDTVVLEPCHLIGKGGYGSIYGAILRSNLPEAGEPMNVAVKRLKRADYGTFRRECIVLQALRGTGIVPNPYAFGQDEDHLGEISNVPLEPDSTAWSSAGGRMPSVDQGRASPPKEVPRNRICPFRYQGGQCPRFSRRSAGDVRYRTVHA